MNRAQPNPLRDKDSEEILQELELQAKLQRTHRFIVSFDEDFKNKINFKGNRDLDLLQLSVKSFQFPEIIVSENVFYCEIAFIERPGFSLYKAFEEYLIDNKPFSVIVKLLTNEKTPIEEETRFNNCTIFSIRRNLISYELPTKNLITTLRLSIPR